MPNYLGKIVYLTEAQKEILFSQGSITVGTTTITYSADDLYITTDGVLPVSGGGTGLSAIGTSGQVLKVNSAGTALEWGSSGGVGTVTSVQVQATSPVQSSTSTAQTSTLDTTISLADGYGDTKNPYGSKTKNYVLAAPSSAAGNPSFRALVADDIPSITKSKISDFPTSMTPTSHTHGNITNGGDITATAPTIASGDQIIINDHSASKITNGPTFDGSTVTMALTPKGTWEHFDNSVWYGTCNTAADTAAKVVTCSGFTLTDGAVVLVRFENTNTAAAANLTLNVNNTGAKAIKIFQNASLINSAYNGVIYAGAVMLCYYYHVGTTEYWVLDTNTNSYVAYSNTTTASWRSLLQSTNTISTANSAISAGTGVIYASQGIAVQPSTATMRASIYNVADKVQLQYNSTTDALDFVFI